MRVLIQRVTQAAVTIGGTEHARIGPGMLLLVGIEQADAAPDAAPDATPDAAGNDDDIEWLTGKIARLRIFDDPAGVMNLDVTQAGGEILAISQFTLHASTKKGNRPSYIKAARPETAEPLYIKFIAKLAETCKIDIKTGVFGKNMQIALTNDGPVTIAIDSKNRE